MGIDRKVGEGIQRAKREVHKRTGTSNTGLRQKNEDRSRCIRLCYRGFYLWNIRMGNRDQWHSFQNL